MSDSGILQQFNINELAGATGLILGALGGILAIIFKSRCYCRLNLCYLCYCERKPPPDSNVDDSDDDDSPKKKKDKKEKEEKEKKEKEEKEKEEKEKKSKSNKNKTKEERIIPRVEEVEEELVVPLEVP